MHQIFHIFSLKNYVGDPLSIVPLESVGMKYSLTYEEILVDIVDL